MSPLVFVSLSGALTFGAPLVICLRELLVLRREDKGGSWPGNQITPQLPAPRPLPDCLIPRPSHRPQPERVRELV
jgi:hypothetical protein